MSKEKTEVKEVEKVEEVIEQDVEDVISEKNPIEEKVEKLTDEQLNEKIQKSIIEFTEFIKKEKIKISINLALTKDGKIVMSSFGSELELSHLWMQFLQRNPKLNKIFHIFLLDSIARNLQQEK